MVSRQEELLERIEIALRENRAPLEKIDREIKKLAGVGAVLKSIDKEISKTFSEANELQKKGLAVGTSLSNFTDRMGKNIETLNSGLTGYSQALKTSFELYDAGIRRNNDGLVTLAQFTKATGGNSAALAKQLAKNLAGGQVTDKELNNLGMNTISLSQRFGISAEKIVGAVDALGNQLDSLKALNLGAEALEASQKLAAALGPEMAALGPELLGSFTKGSSLIQTEILNLGNERRAFLAGGEQAANAGIDLVLKAGTESQKIIEQFTAGTTDAAFALELAGSVYGQEIVKAAKARQQLENKATEAGFKNVNEYVKSLKQQAEINENFTKTLGSLREKIFSPIQEAVTFLARILIKVLELPVIGKLIENLGKVGVIVGLLVSGTLGLVMAFRGLKNALTTLIKSSTDLLNSRKQATRKQSELQIAIKELKLAIKENTIRAQMRAKGLMRDEGGRLRNLTGRFVSEDKNKDILKASKDQAKQIAESNKKSAKVAGGLLLVGTVLPAAVELLPKGMQDAVQPFADGIGTLITAFGALQSAITLYATITGKQFTLETAKQGLSKVGSLPGAGKAGGLVKGLGSKFFSAIKFIGPMLIGLGSTLLAGIGAALSAAAAVITSPITLIVAGIAALGAIIYKFKDAIWGAIKWIWSKVWGAITWLAKTIWDGLKWVGNKLNPANWFGGDEGDKSPMKSAVEPNLPKARYNRQIAQDLKVEIVDSLRSASNARARGDFEQAEAFRESAYTANNIYNAMMAAKEAQEKQLSLAENAEEARQAQLVATREDKTRPSQMAGIEPTSR